MAAEVLGSLRDCADRSAIMAVDDGIGRGDAGVSGAKNSGGFNIFFEDALGDKGADGVVDDDDLGVWPSCDQAQVGGFLAGGPTGDSLDGWGNLFEPIGMADEDDLFKKV